MSKLIPWATALLLLTFSAAPAAAKVVCDCDGSEHKDGFFCEPYCLGKKGRGARRQAASGGQNKQVDQALQAVQKQAVDLLIQNATKTRSPEEIAADDAKLDQQNAQLQATLAQQGQPAPLSSPASAKMLMDLDKLDGLDDDDEDQAPQPLKPVPQPRLRAVPTVTVQGVNVNRVAESPQKDQIWVSNPNNFAVDVQVYLSDFSTCNCTHVLRTVTIPPGGNVNAGWVGNSANNDPWPYNVGVTVAKHGKGHVNYAP